LYFSASLRLSAWDLYFSAQANVFLRACEKYSAGASLFTCQGNGIGRLKQKSSPFQGFKNQDGQATKPALFMWIFIHTL